MFLTRVQVCDFPVFFINVNSYKKWPKHGKFSNIIQRKTVVFFQVHYHLKVREAFSSLCKDTFNHSEFRDASFFFPPVLFKVHSIYHLHVTLEDIFFSFLFAVFHLPSHTINS